MSFAKNRPLIAAARFVFVVLAAIAPPIGVARADVIAGFDGQSLGGMAYRLFTPAGYDKAKAYPLVITLHGAGDGDATATKLLMQSGDMPLLFASAGVQAKHPAFVLAPACTASRWVEWDWTLGSYELSKIPISTCMMQFNAIFAAVRATYNIDSDRIYVSGISMGGFGTWDLLLRNPQTFAAAIPISGGGSPTDASLIAHLPIWTFHSTDDGIVPSLGTREMWSALVAAGGSPTFTEFASSSHVDWPWVAANPGLADWLFSNKRGGPHGGYPAPDLAFSPASGNVDAGTTVAISSALPTPTLFAALGVADPLTVMVAYSKPFAITGPIIVSATAQTTQGGVPNRTVHHAATFEIGSSTVADGGASDSGAGGGSGGASQGGTSGRGGTAGSGGATGGGGNAGVGGTAGNAGAAGNAGNGGGSAGGEPGASNAGNKQSSGCRYGGGRDVSTSVTTVLFMAVFFALSRSRRKRSRH